MKEQNAALLYTQKQCEEILIRASTDINISQGPIGRISRVLLESTYREWTDILKLIYGEESEPWNIKDECEIINNPKKIPEVMLRVIDNIKDVGVCHA